MRRLLSKAFVAAACLVFAAACGGDDGAGDVGCQKDADCAAARAANPCIAAPTCAQGECLAGAALDDGSACLTDKCLTGQSCAAGECQGGQPKCLEDDDPCTRAFCSAVNGACGSEALADLSPCDDNNVCTEGDVCFSGSCSGVAKACDDDGNPCTLGQCDVVTGGCVATAVDDGADCEDGDLCTVGDTCLSGACLAGVSPCNESVNPCTVAECNPTDGQCVDTPVADDSPCDDNDLCSLDDRCEAGSCVGDATSCDESTNLCLVNVCQSGTGACQPEPVNGSPLCDDGDGCTKDDACVGGVCVGAPKGCADDGNNCTVVQCVAGACAGIPKGDNFVCDDGDLCTDDGTCQSGVCTIGAPKCPGDDNSCTVSLCDEITGDCSIGLLDSGTPCDVLNPCTLESWCQDGSCTGGSPVVCPDDGDPCTIGLCIPQEGGCVTVTAPEGAVCEDGDLCTEGESCIAGQCVGGAAKECPEDDNLCTTSGCDPAMGCTKTPVEDGQACDDESLCTGGDHCKFGSCAGSVLPCEPISPCASAACAPESGCQQAPINEGLPCDDSDACTSDTLCSEGSCIGGETVACDDPDPNDPCTIALCNPLSGVCVTTGAPESTLCDDGDPCTLVDFCDFKDCVGSGPDPCGEDANPCIPFECQSDTGDCTPKTLPDGAQCDAKNLCTTTGTCASGQCSSVAIVNCPPTSENCKISVCHPKSGQCTLEIAPDGAACDDGELCTTGSSCFGALCQLGGPASCPDDGNPCTIESCLPGVGCQSIPMGDGTPCTDGDPCTSNSACSAGSCVGGSLVLCPADGDACTSDQCVAGQGCLYPPIADGGACDDGSACTEDDLCQSGVCVGSELACPDLPDPCIVSQCNPASGVCEVLFADGTTACDDGSACTENDYCEQGECLGVAKLCPQGDNPCLIGICDPGLDACVLVPTVTGSACDDGQICTVSDACDGQGGCVGSPPDCPDPGIPCRQAGCDLLTGACTVELSPNGSACDAGVPCIAGDFCLAGDCQLGASPSCVPSSSCHSVSCDEQSGECTESVTADGAACVDNDACTDQTVCTSGECGGGQKTQCPDDGNSCTSEVCNATTGLCESILSDDGALCDDADPCTHSDSCTDAVCAGLAKNCGDSGQVCIALVCDPQSGDCAPAPAEDGSGCDDGNVCTIGELCAQSDCVGQPAECPETGSECQSSQCEAANGCVLSNAANGTVCTNNPCFKGTHCEQGQCVGGAPIACPAPAEPCLVASCDEATGCATQEVVWGTACDDSNACTSNTTCAGGVCAGESVSCAPAEACHAVACDPVDGCVSAALDDGVACDDGNACTVGDQCAAGACVGGSDLVCDGGSDCQPETCDPASGLCFAGLSDDGSPCDDGNPCTQNTACVAGACVGGDVPSCEQPESPCLTALCSPVSGGCALFALPDETACDDGSLCTNDDACKAGVCVGKPAVSCGAADGCLVWVCDPSTGLCASSLAPNGAPCNDGDACVSGEVCHFGVCQPGTASPLCCNASSDCDDGTICTTDSCVAGRCQYSLNALPACIGRVLIAAQVDPNCLSDFEDCDSQLVILDAQTLAPVGPPIAANGRVLGLAVGRTAGLVFAATNNLTSGLMTIDPLLPLAQIVGPSVSGAAASVVVDDSLNRVAVTQNNGFVTVYDMGTATQVGNSVSIVAPVGRPTIDIQSHRLYQPSLLGYLSIVSLDATPQVVPSTPWLVGGILVAAAYDPAHERVFMADTQADVVRLVDALHGAGAAGNTLGDLGEPADVVVDAQGGRVFVAYPFANKVGVFQLADLSAGVPPSAAIPDAPARVLHDPLMGRLFVLSSKGNQLHVLKDSDLSVPAGPPVVVGAAPVDIAVLWSRPGRLVLNEAMLQPVQGATEDGQWIEVHNPSAESQSLDGLVLKTTLAEYPLSSVVQPATDIPAGGFAVICSNPDAATNGGVSCDYSVDATPPLLTSGLILTLVSAAGGAVLDRADLTGEVPSGLSLALKHPGFNNGRALSWEISLGTAGAANDDVGN